MEADYQKFKGDGFMVITLLDSGTSQAWVSMHSLTYPVLEVDSDTAWKYWETNSPAYPSLKMIKPGMVVAVADQWPPPSDSDIQGILP